MQFIGHRRLSALRYGWTLALLVFLPAAAMAADGAASVSFRNEVQPILARFGCSSGACHGAAAGQNGFRLSLRGYDDTGDWLSITRHYGGRRVNVEDPGRSLLLLKATATLPHKGERRFAVDSREYQVLANWIAQGAPGPRDTDATLTKLEIRPSTATLTMDAVQPLTVLAHFSDGQSHDVTAWAKYTSANESVCQVDSGGTAKITGHGEGAVTAWYLQKIAVSTLTVPFPNDPAAEIFAAAPRVNWIDEHVMAKLTALRLPPSPSCTDAEFLRRAFLDTIGVLPDSAETRAFLADSNPDKRSRLIAALLQRPEFIDYWTHKWSDLFLISSRKLKQPAALAYHRWLRSRVAANTPWDVLAREILTAKGSALENGAANFFVLHEDPRELAETTTQAFLGMSVNCARCHNHPMEKWTNTQYYAFANLFARVRTKAGSGAEGDVVVFAAPHGDLVQPLTGKAPAPAPLDATAVAPEDAADRREIMAAWLTGPQNRGFARAIVNRVWANFFGVGLVEKVDDLRDTNPASNEALMAAAAAFLTENKFDLKALMSAILHSAAYQRSSVALPGNAGDTRFYSRYYPRRLMAEVLADALSKATGVPTEWKVDIPYGQQRVVKEFPAGTRALELPDGLIRSYFLKSFGKADREKTCECERTSEPSVAQVLHIANGETLNAKLTSPAGRVAAVWNSKPPAAEIVEDAWLRCLNRMPTAEEAAAFVKSLQAAPEQERRAVIEDIYWALLASREFLFNH